MYNNDSGFFPFGSHYNLFEGKKKISLQENP